MFFFALRIFEKFENSDGLFCPVLAVFQICFVVKSWMIFGLFIMILQHMDDTADDHEWPEDRNHDEPHRKGNLYFFRFIRSKDPS